MSGHRNGWLSDECDGCLWFWTSSSLMIDRSRSDPSINGHLHYPNDIDTKWSFADKIRKYRSDYNNNPPEVISLCLLLLVRLGGYTVNLCVFCFYKIIWFSQIKPKAGLVLVKDTSLRITINIDGTLIASRSHTHPSHSQTSRLSISSLSLGIPVPHTTQGMWRV